MISKGVYLLQLFHKYYGDEKSRYDKDSSFTCGFSIHYNNNTKETLLSSQSASDIDH